MLNEQKNQLYHGSPDTNERNDSTPDPLSDAGKTINQAQYEPMPASNDFKDNLKAKIIEARHRKFRMPNLANFFVGFLRPRRLMPVLAFLVIVAVIITTAHYWPSGTGVNQFSKLLISPAYAQDNFSVEATDSDTLGIGAGTSFVIKSKEKVSSALLKENLKLEPDVDYDFTVVNDNEFKITPKKNLENRKIYKVVIAASFVAENGITMARDYSWAFSVKDEFKILNTIPGNETPNVALDTGIEITFSHENFADFEKAITIEPKVEGRWEKHKRTAVFVPKELKSGAIYTVTVSKTLAVTGSESGLKEDYVFKFETDSTGKKRGEYWQFGFTRQYNEVSTKNEPAFGVYNYGLDEDKFPMDVHAFPSIDSFITAMEARDKVPYWATYNRDEYRLDAKNLKKVATYDLKTMEYGYNKYLVLPSVLPAGFYLAEVKVKDSFRQVFFQVSDIVVYTSVTKTDTLVWVNDLVSQGSIAKAKVEVIGKDISKLTSEDGVVTFDSNQAFDVNDKAESDNWKKSYVKITDGNRYSISPLEISNYWYGDQIGNENYWYYFYSDRSLYKPDDKVNFWGFLEGRKGEPIDSALTVELSGYSYFDYSLEAMPIATVPVTKHDGGTFLGSLNLEKLTPGYYTLSLKLDKKVVAQRSIEVQTYTKPAYQLEITPEKKAIFAGQDIKAKVKASFFEGTPVSSLDLMFNAFKADEGIKTNKQGEAAIARKTEYLDCTFERDYCGYPDYTYINVWPKNSEEGEITGTTTVAVFGASISSRVEFNQENDTQVNIITTIRNIDINKINQGDEELYGDYFSGPAADINFKAKITEIDYEKSERGEYYDFINKVVRKIYDYRRVEKELVSYNGVTDENGKFVYNLKIDPEKSYVATILAADGAGRHDRTAAYLYTSKDYEATRQDDSYNLRLKDWEQNKTAEFSLGEKVNVEFVKNDEILPVDNTKRFLYYRLQRGLKDYTVSTDSLYGFDFAPGDVPNVCVAGVWFDGKNYHTTAADWRWGWYSSGLNIRFAQKDKEIKIDVTSDKDKYAPGDEVTLKVKTTDKDDKPLSAKVNLNLIDEAFYQLSYESADPLSGLYQNLDDGVLLTYVAQPEAKAGSGAEGGGCFLAGTKITMADGRTRNIEDIKIGDEILTFENELAGKTVKAKVANTFKHEVGGYLLINGMLKVTPEHRVFLNKGWQMIGEAKMGDYFFDEKRKEIRINSIEYIPGIVDVYSFTVERYHTFFANGIYVHNDKGGPRKDFPDAALFIEVSTDSNGEAATKFKLPDNLTSWRVTSQAINDDLYAGMGTSDIKVSLPVFVQTTFAKEYLEKDKPTIKMLAYGNDLKEKDKVKFTLKAPGFGLANLVKDGEAFVPTYVDIPKLNLGTQKVEVGVMAGKNSDSVEYPVSVIKSRLQEGTQKFYELKEGLKIEGSATDRTNLIFSDKNQGQFYSELMDLGWTYGDRIDQKLSRALADELRVKYFDDEIFVKEEIATQVYQQRSGGISLLPYSSVDLELSAKIAYVAPEYFDKVSLKSYFYQILNNKDSNPEEYSLALFGLSSFDEPILYFVQNFSTVPDLIVKDRLFVALAAARLGDTELARKIYLEILQEKGEKLDPYLRINDGKDDDDREAATALAAIVAAAVNDENRDALWQYAKEKHTTEILTNMEKLMYIATALPQLKSGEVKFTVIVNGKSTEKTLSRGETFKASLTPSELASISFKDISGAVGVVSSFSKPASTLDLNYAAPVISLKREYYVKGKKVDQFKEDDSVEIRIYPSFTDKSPNDYYQITDFLPSGLKAITKLYSYNIEYKCDTRYPYDINGQMVKFGLYRDWNKYSCHSTYFRYYARVVNPGEYVAESALLQSLKAMSMKSYSAAGVVKITQ